MTPRLESLMHQAFQLNQNERLELIAHLASSLQSGDCNSVDLVLADDQKAQLKQLQAEIDLGLEDINAGRVLDGETVFANLQQRVTTQQDWLQKLTGSVSDEAVFLEAMEYGSAFRSMQPQQLNPESP